jgi:hypothetical protein
LRICRARAFDLTKVARAHAQQMLDDVSGLGTVLPKYRDCYLIASVNFTSQITSAVSRRVFIVIATAGFLLSD